MSMSGRVTRLTVVTVLLSLCGSLIISAPVRAETTINFDAYKPGTRIDVQYAGLGVYFLNDYHPDAFYHLTK